MITEISNEKLTLRVESTGAEVVNLILNNGRDVMWTADPHYWEKKDPILFPCIGNNWAGQIQVEGNAYPLGKHGFIRDLEFELTAQTQNSLTYCACETPETLKSYPFTFRFEVIYTLSASTLSVCWRVHNTNNKVMPFMVGAHPAFILPDYHDGEVHGYLRVKEVDELLGTRTMPYGYAQPEIVDEFELTNHLLPLTDNTFECDTILDRTERISEVELLDKEKKELVSVRFNMPVIAIWSPKNGQCPFVCIEPWCGSCDTYQYEGEFHERPFINTVNPEESWENTYYIDVKG